MIWNCLAPSFLLLFSLQKYKFFSIMMKARFANLFMFMNWHLTFATPNRDRFLFISIDKSLVKKIKVACQLLCHKSRWHVTNCAKCLFLSPPPPLLEVHFSLMNSVFAALPLCGIWTMKQALEDIFIIMLKSSSIILYGCLPSSVPLWLNSCLIGIFIHWTELTSFSSKMSK